MILKHRRKNVKPYGVKWDESNSSPTLERIGQGNSATAATKLPENLLAVQSKMRRCVLNDSGEVQYYLCSTDSTLREDCSTPANIDGSDGQVMVQIPLFWYRYDYSGTTHSWLISPEQFQGAERHPAFYKNGAWVDYRYMSAYEGILYDDSASRYTNGLDLSAHNVGFDPGSKTVAFQSGGIETVNMTAAASGTGYTVSDVLTLTGGTTNGTVTVATIDGGGGVLSVTLTTDGYGHSTGVVGTTGGTGANCTVNIVTLDTNLNHPYTKLQAGDKLTIAGTSSNNGTFTVSGTGDTSFTVDESVTNEDYAASATIKTQKNWTATTGDKLSSVSGKAPINDGTRANFRAAAKNRGTGWRQQDYDLVAAIHLLYVTEYASWNSQSVIGPGLTNFDGAAWLNRNDYNPIESVGLSNGLGNASGSVDNGSDSIGSYMSYRGIENFFGHIWKWVDGFNINGGIPYVCNNDTQFVDDTDTNYTRLEDIDGSGITLPQGTNSYQVTLEQINRGFLPASVVGGSNSTYITDYYYQFTGWRVARLGGRALSGGLAGFFDWTLNTSSSYLHRHFGGRVCF
jgi:hypothetical protein